jgi:hypothetical protein
MVTQGVGQTCSPNVGGRKGRRALSPPGLRTIKLYSE